ncbi:hypothetical protein BDFB_009577 [Asbolus verrucosus]|uniref:Uncharacterized protein n=1 Tax=Asbolus verrucosus TaxID=1661398 RepID=A0A482WAB2_ASBVE|nr:hypothetical protein BDFB_009577 [Asbolus verrucosus]
MYLCYSTPVYVQPTPDYNRQRFPHRRVPNRRTFMNAVQRQRDHGTFTAAECILEGLEMWRKLSWRAWKPVQVPALREWHCSMRYPIRRCGAS